MRDFLRPGCTWEPLLLSGVAGWEQKRRIPRGLGQKSWKYLYHDVSLHCLKRFALPSLPSPFRKTLATAKRGRGNRRAGKILIYRIYRNKLYFWTVSTSTSAWSWWVMVGCMVEQFTPDTGFWILCFLGWMVSHIVFGLVLRIMKATSEQHVNSWSLATAEVWAI